MAHDIANYLSDLGIDLFTRGVDAPKPKATQPLEPVEDGRHGHDEINPVGGRHDVDGPGEVSVRKFRFARHFGKSPEILGPEEIRTYQVYLTNEKKLAISSILIAICALRFLYKVTLKKN